MTTRQEPTPRTKAKIQALPSPTQPGKRVSRHAYQPTVESVTRNYSPDEAQAVFTAMGQSLTFGFTFALLEPYQVPEQPELTTRMMVTNVGRGFWSWEDIPEPDLSALEKVAMRPSRTMPADMRCVSPRLACDMLGGNYNAVQRMLEQQGIEVAISLSTALGLAGYGTMQDARLPLLKRILEPSARPGYSRRQSFIMDISGDVRPFAEAISQTTLYADELGRRLREAKDELVQDVIAVYAAKGIEVFAEDIFFEEVVDDLMRSPWDVRVPDQPDDANPEPVLRRLLIQRFGSGREGAERLTGEMLVGLSRLTGISPASFAAYAVTDFERRGMTYVEPAGIRVAADLVRDEGSGRAAVARAALADELEQLADELDTAGARKDDQDQMILSILAKTRGWELAFPEWGLAKKLHRKLLGTAGSDDIEVGEE